MGVSRLAFCCASVIFGPLSQIGVVKSRELWWNSLTEQEKQAYFERERRMEAAWRRRQQLEREMREDPDGLTAAGESVCVSTRLGICVLCRLLGSVCMHLRMVVNAFVAGIPHTT